MLLVLLRLMNRDSSRIPASAGTHAPPPASAATASNESRDRLFARLPHRRSASESGPTAEQIVANKVRQFARHRRALAHALAGGSNIQVPADVERFFAAVESGNRDEIDAAFKPIGERYKTKPPPRDLEVLWGPILESLGVAESAQDWPAQRLLDYGEAVLGSLRPGMVYVGGTDPGRFIPTLLNETSEGERHVVLTQNAFADGTYLKYIEALYGDRLQTLTTEDSQKVFQDYMRDTQERLRNNQLRPGEDVKVVDNRVTVSGQVAVMAINE